MFAKQGGTTERSSVLRDGAAFCIVHGDEGMACAVLHSKEVTRIVLR